MLRVRGWLQANHSGKLILALLVAVFCNVLISHMAAAGGPIMVGLTYISGKDQVSGATYEDPHNMLGNNRTARTIRVYSGDKVRFYERIMNVDPPIIWILPTANCNYPVSVKYHRVYYDNKGNIINDSVVQSYRSKPIYPLYNSVGFENYPRNAFDPTCYLRGMQPLPASSAVPYHEVNTADSPGSSDPGSQVCQYVETNPTVVDFLWVPQIVVGKHTFNSHNDYLAVPLPVLQNFPFISFGIGDMMSCAEIAYNYNLVPSIELPGSGGGGSINVSPSVSQDPSVDMAHATYTQDTQWQVTQVIKPKGVSGPTAGIDNNQPCNAGGTAGRYKVNNQYTCKVVSQSSGKSTVFYPNGSFKSGDPFPSNVPAASPGDYPPGDPASYQVCYVLSINAYKPYITSNTWRHSALVCPPETKQPTVHILGDDVRVGGAITTSPHAKDAVFKEYGSWSEYASYSRGTTSSTFSTQSGLKGGAASGVPPLTLNSLTFANSSPVQFGHFTTTTSPNSPSLVPTNSVAEYFAKNAKKIPSISGTIDLPTVLSTIAGDATGTGVKPPVKLDDNLTDTTTLTGDVVIPKGKTIVIVATGTVVIKSNITYTTDTLTSLNDIPQMVIVAHNIQIDPQVGTIDAWLVADTVNGVLTTCYPAPVQLTMGDCVNKLRVNGPVATNKLHLYRTGGSNDDASLDDAAETFSNRGDAYLWAQNYATSPGTYTTTMRTELPPRY